jgi:hypothetical protein
VFSTFIEIVGVILKGVEFLDGHSFVDILFGICIMIQLAVVLSKVIYLFIAV